MPQRYRDATLRLLPDVIRRHERDTP